MKRSPFQFWHQKVDQFLYVGSVFGIKRIVLPIENHEIYIEDYFGTIECGQLKERGFSHWEAPNRGGNNSSGFTTLPGGFRSSKGGFYSLGEDAAF